MKMHWIKVAITLSWKIRYHQHRSIITTKIWLNPPYNQSVSTYPARTLLKLIDRHFPRLSRFYKIFNRNIIKVSYSCTDNIEQHVKKHNNYAQQKKKGNIQPGCNCRDKFGCPLNGKYRTENIIYKCTSLNESNLKKVYLGLAEEEFVIIAINNFLETKNIKKPPHCQPTYGTAKEHLRNLLIWKEKHCDKLLSIQKYKSPVFYPCMKS